MADDNPPEGFLRIDFDRGRPDPTFNGHIGNLYAKRGAKGSRDEFVWAFACRAICAIRQAACMAA